MNNAEAQTLAERIAAAYRGMVELYRGSYGMSTEEALAKVEQPPAEQYLEQIRQSPPREISWYQLGELAKVDTGLVARCWEAIVEAAREDLGSGQWAARAVRDVHNAGPWELAHFLALRQELADQWQPRGGIEWSLIDTLVQSLTEQHRWIAAANNFLARDCDNHRRELEAKEKWLPPRLTEAQALEQAMAMAERWNRIFLRTLRALRDLRRYAPSVTIQNAGQVNIGSQQVNLAE